MNVVHQWRLDDIAYDACVREIYQAAIGVGSWKQACEIISDALELTAVSIIGVDRNNQSLLFHWQGGHCPAQTAVQYITTFHRENPWLQAALVQAPDSWLHDHELLREADVAASHYYQKFAIPNSCRYASIAKLADDGEQVVLLSAMRSTQAGPLEPEQLHELSRFRGHFVDAIRMHKEVHSRDGSASVGHSMLEALPQAVFVVDEMRRILYCNRSAGDMLETDRNFAPGGQALTLADAKDDARLTAMIHSLSQPGHQLAGPTGNGFVTRIGDAKQQTDLVVVGRAFRTEQDSAAGRPAMTQIMLIVHPIRGAAEFDPTVIGSIFQLTPAEAIVAAALARGETPEEVAKRRGVSLHTIRTQIRAVYTKMKVTRQADLARLLAQIPKLEN